VTERLPDYLRERSSYPHWTPVPIRFRDLDLLGHVNNVALAGWLEEGRVSMELPVQPMVPNYSPVVVLVELRIQFLEETRYGDPITVGTGVERIGRTSVSIGQGIFADDRCLAIARASEVLIDGHTRGPIPWPSEFSSLFERYRIT
jgi:acyl-CoA thioester hydrolase